jgi:tetratricopeptide (TPR) repeat protein
MDAMTSVAPSRHPWLDRLIAAPAAEVRALVEGTASIYPFGRAEPTDAAATVLFGLAPDDPAVQALDQGALETLMQYRGATVRAEATPGDRIALAALDLMKLVQRLAPRNTVMDLHHRFTYWNARAETLVVDRGLDLRREYFRVLSLTQDIAAEASLAPRRLLPFWLEICSEAGSRGRYDESYLAVGLVGLRSLPLGEEGANEEAALFGLARWADAQRPTKVRFLREWHVLEGAFPRDPTFWTDLVVRVLSSVEEEIARQTNNKRGTFPAAAWWREDVDAIRGAHVEPRAAEWAPPQRELREVLLSDIDSGKAYTGAFHSRLETLMERHERYATCTGDTFYLVRTACNIGMHLLRGSDMPKRRAAKARELARLALRFEPANVFAWALWRDALAAEGHLEAAELLGWETFRRFPENPQWRNQLALLLSDRLERPHEAESLLRETMRLFPDEVVSRNQLAMLLSGRLGQPHKAESLLRETIRLFPDDRKQMVVARTQLANIIGREAARLSEAIAILTEALSIEPTNEIAQAMKQRLEQGRTTQPPKPATSPLATSISVVAGLSDLPTDLVAAARLRRALFRVHATDPQGREIAKLEVEKLLSEDENLAYARYVAAAAGVREPAADDTVLATAFLAANRQDATAVPRPFITHAHGIDSVIIVMAGASRGDAEAAQQLKAGLAEPANDLSPRDRGLREIAARIKAPIPAEFVGDMLAASLGVAMAA